MRVLCPDARYLDGAISKFWLPDSDVGNSDEAFAGMFVVTEKKRQEGAGRSNAMNSRMMNSRFSPSESGTRVRYAATGGSDGEDPSGQVAVRTQPTTKGPLLARVRADAR